VARRDAVDRGEFGALLRKFRAAANLTQEELADRSGLSVQAIRALEQGNRQSPRPSTVEWLADALRLDAPRKEAFVAAARGRSLDGPEHSYVTPDARSDLAEAGTLLASMPTDTLPPRAPLPAGSRMPLAPNPLFVGRGEELLRMACALHGTDNTVALVASTGLGGLGKTQLAVEFVHRYGRFFAGGVFWLGFASADEIPLQVAACAGPDFEARSLEERVQRVRQSWQSAMSRLLVFDNCEEESLLEEWRPTSGGCRIMITSRRSHWSPTLGVTALPLDLLPRTDSIELLLRYRPGLAPEDPGLDAIAQELGDLPLALHLAGSYLRAYRAEVSLDDYLAELRRSEVVQHASLLGAGLDDSISPTHHVLGVAQTFSLCLARLDPDSGADRVAIALLARMACMAPGEPVPRDLLATTMEDVDPLLRADALRRLGAVGLVEEGNGWLRLHRLLVHFVRQERLDPDAQPAVDRALISCGESAEQGHMTGSALAAVIPHLVDVAGTAGRETGNERRQAELCTAAGRALHHAGDLRAAGPWYEGALSIRERILGPDHPDTATGLNSLALLLWSQGELAAARPLFERALATRERVLGPDHPDTAAGVNDLALLLHDAGELSAAGPLFERALATRQRVLGAAHLDTAESLNNLARLLWSQSDLAAGKALYEHALAIWERVLGLDHPRTALGLHNLGVLLLDQGEVAAARTRLERALAIWERVLGADHPNIALSIHGLARLRHKQGDLDAARTLFERALAIRERALGPDHPRVARTLTDLGALMRNQGELASSKRILERARAIHEHVVGSDHPDTATCLQELASLLKEQGELDNARPLLERALSIRERVLRFDHPDILATRRALEELAAEADGPSTDG
jgi:tetratricopeptide (TPR) repeat protein/transcriptional regulator with XRE-family HTH domain